MAESMVEFECNVPIPSTPQELEQAIRRYKSVDLSGNELFCYWQAIRNAALEQTAPEPDSDRIAGDDSY
jgi:hypothetical protein